MTASSEIAVSLSDVTVRYRVPKERISSFKHYAIRWLKRDVVFEPFCALDRVTFDVKKGEVFGIVGANGAGKSTLLKLVAGVLRPSGGRVQALGRVAPLLELGAGFDQELTGRENVYLYGAVLGFRRAEIARRFEGIVDFAGIERFIDAPLRTYSAGMQARLGFAVATAAEPDILIIDEVLAVGDVEFQQKSAERLEQFRRNGATVLMVSHDLESISGLCARAVWLDRGSVLAAGPAHEVVTSYAAAWAR